MKILNKLDTLDNIQDGETRKLITKTQSSGTGNAITGIGVSGDTLTLEKNTSFATSDDLDDKQDKISFNSTYDATTNKAATMSDIVPVTLKVWTSADKR